MIFLKQNLLPLLASGFLVTLVVAFLVERGFFRWIETYWFLKRSPWHWIGTLLTALGLGMLSVVLLDPRSGEIKIKGKIKQDRTIILIDTSTSMLAEDVRPNRLEKGIMVAKHFVRKAVGHQVSIMVFADISKKLVPFTSDVDLLDARLDSIKTLRNLNAGSSIGIAIEEAVQYFDVKDKSVSGNIIVITDGEDNADTESFKVPDNISLALVGVGTAEGGPIPMKDSMGFHHGNKKQAAKTVITRLNEEFFRNAVKDVKVGKSFLVRSYDLPTEQMLEFFNQRKSGEKDGENMIRPVAMEFWAVPGLTLLALGLFLRSFRPFVTILLIFSLQLAQAQDEPKLSPELLMRLEQLRRGELDQRERVNLADQLARAKAHKLAQEIYQENLGPVPDDADLDSHFNWATSELESEQFASALKRYDQLEKKLAPKSPMLEKIRENIRRAVVSSQQKNQQDQKKEDQKESDKKDDQSEGKDQQQKPSDGKGEGEPKDGKDKGEKNPFDPKNKDKPQEGKDPEPKDEKGEEEKKEERGDDGDEEEKKPRPKVSPLLEQLKQDDRKLQNKLLDVSTQKRKPGRKKDW